MTPTTRTTSNSSESSSTNLYMTPEINEIIQKQVQEQLAVIMSNQNQIISEQQRWINIDKAFVTPQFQIRTILDHERLTGHKNYKSWRTMIELDLKALNLIAFIKTEWSRSKCIAE